MSFYEDSSCAILATFADIFDGNGPGCALPPPGSTFGSIKAEMLVDEPGSCVASGGVQTGEIVRTRPTTFCCQPLP